MGDKWMTSGASRLRAHQNRTFHGRSRKNGSKRHSILGDHVRDSPMNGLTRKGNGVVKGSYSEYADPLARRGIGVSLSRRNEPEQQQHPVHESRIRRRIRDSTAKDAIISHYNPNHGKVLSEGRLTGSFASHPNAQMPPKNYTRPPSLPPQTQTVQYRQEHQPSPMYSHFSGSSVKGSVDDNNISPYAQQRPIPPVMQDQRIHRFSPPPIQQNNHFGVTPTTTLHENAHTLNQYPQRGPMHQYQQEKAQTQQDDFFDPPMDDEHMPNKSYERGFGLATMPRHSGGESAFQSYPGTQQQQQQMMPIYRNSFKEVNDTNAMLHYTNSNPPYDHSLQRQSSIKAAEFMPWEGDVFLGPSETDDPTNYPAILSNPTMSTGGFSRFKRRPHDEISQQSDNLISKKRPSVASVALHINDNETPALDDDERDFGILPDVSSSSTKRLKHVQQDKQVFNMNGGEDVKRRFEYSIGAQTGPLNDDERDFGIFPDIPGSSAQRIKQETKYFDNNGGINMKSRVEYSNGGQKGGMSSSRNYLSSTTNEGYHGASGHDRNQMKEMCTNATFTFPNNDRAEERVQQASAIDTEFLSFSSSKPTNDNNFGKQLQNTTNLPQKMRDPGEFFAGDEFWCDDNEVSVENFPSVRKPSSSPLSHLRFFNEGVEIDIDCHPLDRPRSGEPLGERNCYNVPKARRKAGDVAALPKPSATKRMAFDESSDDDLDLMGKTSLWD